MTFDEAFAKLIGHEGGYVFDPVDRGGETKYGISKRSYPLEDIRAMTLDRAKELYWVDFWSPCRCDDLPEALRFDVFDAAVNSGVRQATLWLQRAVGAQADGIIGPKTLATARRADPATAMARFNGHRLGAMTDMPTWSAHGRGWARRIAANLKEA